MVEQGAVNSKVASSNLASGAIKEIYQYICLKRELKLENTSNNLLLNKLSNDFIPFWPIRLEVRTLDFHSKNRSSILLWVTKDSGLVQR